MNAKDIPKAVEEHFFDLGVRWISQLAEHVVVPEEKEMETNIR